MTALALLLNDAPEAAQAIRPPFEEAVRRLVPNLDGVLVVAEKLVETPHAEERPERSSVACNEQLTSLAATVQWLRFLATDACKAAVRQEAPDKGDRYAAVIDRFVPWMEAELENYTKWRGFVGAAERYSQESGTPLDELLDNPVARSMYFIPEEKQRVFDELARRGRMWKSPQEELDAAREGRHPYYKKKRVA